MTTIFGSSSMTATERQAFHRACGRIWERCMPYPPCVERYLKRYVLSQTATMRIEVFAPKPLRGINRHRERL